MAGAVLTAPLTLPLAVIFSALIEYERAACAYRNYRFAQGAKGSALNPKENAKP